MNTSPVLPAHVIFTEFNGQDGVLMDLNTYQYFKLNETGTLVWRALEAGTTHAELVALLTREYQVTAEEAALTVEALYHKLASLGLLELS